MISKINKVQLAKKLNTAVDRVIREKKPIVISAGCTLVGEMSVEKNTNGFCIKKSGKIMNNYADIYLYESAVLVARYFSNINMVKEILEIDKNYKKCHCNMLHYIACYKGAKAINDEQRMMILEDKFQLSEQLATDARCKLSKFKIFK